MRALMTAMPSDAGEPVIALHCSGANASQWRKLAEAMGGDRALFAPEHYGCDEAGRWSEDRAFALADEAARTLAIIDTSDRKVHLVGHSYGGAVALHVALARPDRIASLTLYEPSALYLLRQLGRPASAALAEIKEIADAVGWHVATGDHRGAAAIFVDYWGEVGAWNALRPPLQDALARWMPTAPLEFFALFGEPTPESACRRLRVPVLVIRGEHAPAPTRLIAEALPSLMPDCRLTVVAGAGHMGPVTHARDVNALIVRHIAATSAIREPVGGARSGHAAATPAALHANMMLTADHLRRLGDGTIDFDFYHRRWRRRRRLLMQVRARVLARTAHRLFSAFATSTRMPVFIRRYALKTTT